MHKIAEASKSLSKRITQFHHELNATTLQQVTHESVLHQIQQNQLLLYTDTVKFFADCNQLFNDKTQTNFQLLSSSAQDFKNLYAFIFYIWKDASFWKTQAAHLLAGFLETLFNVLIQLVRIEQLKTFHLESTFQSEDLAHLMRELVLEKADDRLFDNSIATIPKFILECVGAQLQLEIFYFLNQFVTSKMWRLMCSFLFRYQLKELILIAAAMLKCRSEVSLQLFADSCSHMLNFSHNFALKSIDSLSRLVHHVIELVKNTIYKNQNLREHFPLIISQVNACVLSWTPLLQKTEFADAMLDLFYVLLLVPNYRIEQLDKIYSNKELQSSTTFSVMQQLKPIYFESHWTMVQNLLRQYPKLYPLYLQHFSVHYLQRKKGGAILKMQCLEMISGYFDCPKLIYQSAMNEQQFHLQQVLCFLNEKQWTVLLNDFFEECNQKPFAILHLIHVLIQLFKNYESIANRIDSLSFYNEFPLKWNQVMEKCFPMKLNNEFVYLQLVSRFLTLLCYFQKHFPQQIERFETNIPLSLFLSAPKETFSKDTLVPWLELLYQSCLAIKKSTNDHSISVLLTHSNFEQFVLHTIQNKSFDKQWQQQSKLVRLIQECSPHKKWNDFQIKMALFFISSKEQWHYFVEQYLLQEEKTSNSYHLLDAVLQKLFFKSKIEMDTSESLSALHSISQNGMLWDTILTEDDTVFFKQLYSWCVLEQNIFQIRWNETEKLDSIANRFPLPLVIWLLFANESTLSYYVSSSTVHSFVLTMLKQKLNHSIPFASTSELQCYVSWMMNAMNALQLDETTSTIVYGIVFEELFVTMLTPLQSHIQYALLSTIHESSVNKEALHYYLIHLWKQIATKEMDLSDLISLIMSTSTTNVTLLGKCLECIPLIENQSHVISHLSHACLLQLSKELVEKMIQYTPLLHCILSSATMSQSFVSFLKKNQYYQLVQEICNKNRQGVFHLVDWNYVFGKEINQKELQSMFIWNHYPLQLSFSQSQQQQVALIQQFYHNPLHCIPHLWNSTCSSSNLIFQEEELLFQFANKQNEEEFFTKVMNSLLHSFSQQQQGKLQHLLLFCLEELLPVTIDATMFVKEMLRSKCFLNRRVANLISKLLKQCQWDDSFFSMFVVEQRESWIKVLQVVPSHQTQQQQQQHMEYIDSWETQGLQFLWNQILHEQNHSLFYEFIFDQQLHNTNQESVSTAMASLILQFIQKSIKQLQTHQSIAQQWLHDLLQSYHGTLQQRDVFIWDAICLLEASCDQCKIYNERFAMGRLSYELLLVKPWQLFVERFSLQELKQLIKHFPIHLPLFSSSAIAMEQIQPLQQYTLLDPRFLIRLIQFLVNTCYVDVSLFLSSGVASFVVRCCSSLDLHMRQMAYEILFKVYHLVRHLQSNYSEEDMSSEALQLALQSHYFSAMKLNIVDSYQRMPSFLSLLHAKLAFLLPEIHMKQNEPWAKLFTTPKVNWRHFFNKIVDTLPEYGSSKLGRDSYFEMLIYGLACEEDFDYYNNVFYRFAVTEHSQPDKFVLIYKLIEQGSKNSGVLHKMMMSGVMSLLKHQMGKILNSEENLKLTVKEWEQAILTVRTVKQIYSTTQYSNWMLQKHLAEDALVLTSLLEQLYHKRQLPIIKEAILAIGLSYRKYQQITLEENLLPVTTSVGTESFHLSMAFFHSLEFTSEQDFILTLTMLEYPIAKGWRHDVFFEDHLQSQYGSQEYLSSLTTLIAKILSQIKLHVFSFDIRWRRILSFVLLWLQNHMQQNKFLTRQISRTLFEKESVPQQYNNIVSILFSLFAMPLVTPMERLLLNHIWLQLINSSILNASNSSQGKEWLITFGNELQQLIKKKWYGEELKYFILDPEIMAQLHSQSNEKLDFTFDQESLKETGLFIYDFVNKLVRFH